MNYDYQRIEKAIQYLDTNFQEQPSLDDLAKYLNMSPFHFQRLFKRWAGISPKKFLQFLTVRHAKKLLQESRSILDVTFESGLSSPGRLHDLFVSIEAITPGEYKTQGNGLLIEYGIHDSPFGRCLIATTDRGICGFYFISQRDVDHIKDQLQENWKNAIIRENALKTKPIVDQIFKPRTETQEQKLPLLLKGTNFQLKVWEALLHIPEGLICSYEDIAKKIGQPAAVRAVGTAIGANPISYIIPCHRVIRKMGEFGNYGGGRERKKALLAWESALKFRESNY
jgi:AraC family transcriptional regulator of adaptative response/methylated-DNA-[protein]-cysteine methyltransferase